MNRHQIVETIGAEYHRANIEEDEWSYAKDAGTLGRLAELLGGGRPAHFKLDRRFTDQDDTGSYAILVETKQRFTDGDERQLASYVEEEYALHRGVKIIAILADTNDDRIKVWKSEVDDEHLLRNETVLDDMAHYKRLFSTDRQNDREAVMRNTYALNELLHRKDIDERNRSQFVGTCLLYVKDEVQKRCHGGRVNESMKQRLQNRWREFSPTQIRNGIGEVLEDLLDGSRNKETKIRLLKRDVLEDQKVRSLDCDDWVEILGSILMNIYRFIDADSSEGQDILNLFFITFNKYVGKADKNQAFTPDHIADFMTRLCEVTFKDRVLDECCGSGSFLVQAMVHELASARRGRTDHEFKELADTIKQEHIFGIENEEKAYGLSTTNMLIHGDGNSNVEFGSCFDKKEFIESANPTVILMNPPYNAKPRSIPDRYKKDWTNAEKEGKSDPTKGMVFVKYLSDIAKEQDWDGVKLAVLLPMGAAIGSKERLTDMKESLLADNTLEAVFSLPADVFYPGASITAVCVLFTLNKPHYVDDGCTPNRKTFFGYCKDDGFVKRKNLGRVELFDKDGHSLWKQTERKWLDLYRNKTIEAGYSAMHAVTGHDEWLAEAYMETDYSKLSPADFQRSMNDYMSYLIKENPVSQDASSMDMTGWKPFRIDSLFTLENGKNKSAADLEEGDETVYVGAKKDGNGIMKHVRSVPNLESKGNCIVFICNGEGSVGYANYMNRSFIGTSDIVAGYNPHLTALSGLFIATVFGLERPRYSWGRKLKQTLASTIIRLPATQHGEPDWKRMEEYMRSMKYGDRIQ